MAGAFRAVADDWSAVYYNPAGLARIEQSQLNFSLGFDSYRPSYDPDVTIDGNSFGFPTGERYPDNIVVDFPSAAGVTVAPFGLPVTAAFAVYQAYDENLQWDIYRFPYGYNDNQGMLPVIDYRNNFDIVEFHSAFATSFSDDRLHAGFGISMRRVDLFTESIHLVPSDLDEPLNARPYDYFPTTSMINAFGLGFGFNLGILYDVSDAVSVGASYFSKSTVTIDGDGLDAFYAPYNEDLHDPDNLDNISMVFSGRTIIETQEVEADVVIPSEFGFGMAYSPSDNVTLSADLAYTRWSEFEDIEAVVKNSTGPIHLDDWPAVQKAMQTPSALLNDWDDAIRLSFGIEALATDQMKVRGGYSYDQSPVPDEAATPLLSDTGDRHHLAGGISYSYRSFEFSAGIEYVAMPERDVDELVDMNNDGVWDNLAGTYSNNAFNTIFSLTIRF
jgi:long-chain fatty acid transport protein